MTRSTALLARMIDTPDLVRGVRALPGPVFAGLVRRIGVEDAGELVALATTTQLVAAFDADLFSNAAPGERERFDVARFATWLEILMEAGDRVAAQRVSELSIDFVVQAIGRMVLVLDHEALLHRMAEVDAGTRRVDKAIESALSEEIDGYLLISRRHDGWDAVLALILALDRDHRTVLERVLDRCAAIAGELLDDLDELADTLTADDANAEDVEAERDDRRARAGYVEPRAARAFLALEPSPERDPITRAYFRELGPIAPAEPVELPFDLRELDDLPRLLPSTPPPILVALRQLPDTVFAARAAELAYLANVLVAGATDRGARYTPHGAAEAVLARLQHALDARGAHDPDAITVVLRVVEADRLFREVRGV